MVQRKLRRHNRNAAPAEGARRLAPGWSYGGPTAAWMSKQQVRFVERYLFYLHQLGLVEPEEELVIGAFTYGLRPLRRLAARPDCLPTAAALDTELQSPVHETHRLPLIRYCSCPYETGKTPNSKGKITKSRTQQQGGGLLQNTTESGQFQVVQTLSR